MSKHVRQYQEGFTAIELLITLFVAAAFLIAGYQLYFVVIKDNALTRDQSRATNVAYNYLRQYSSAASNPCAATTILPSTAITVASLTNVHVTVTATCPYAASTGTNNATNITDIQVTVTYNSPVQTVQENTFVHDTSTQPSPSGPASVTVTGNSTSQVTASWTPPSGYTASSYTLVYSTNSSLTGGTQVTGIAGTSYVITGLSTSTQYYVGVQAAGYQGLSQTTIGTGQTYTNWGVYSLFAVVGDWNGDGNNDLIAYNRTTGNVDLHLGGGNSTFGPAITLANIGTTVRDMIGPGKLPGGTTPILWWDNSDGTGHELTSNGSTGVTGSAVASGTGWNTCTTVFAAPLLFTSGANAGATTIVCENSALTEYTLSGLAVPTLANTFGSGWSAAFGTNVFGAGDFSVNGNGDILGITSAGALDLYSGNGDGTTAGAVAEGSSWVNNYVTGGWDITGDSYTDILRYYSSTNTLYIYKGLGNGAPGATTVVN